MQVLLQLSVAEFRDENHKCKLAAISVRFVAVMSQRFSNMFESSCNLAAIWDKTEVNMAHQ